MRRFTDTFLPLNNRPGRRRGLRKLDDRSMEELHRIFEVSRAVRSFFDTIEKHSDRKAREMGYDGADDEFMMDSPNTKNSKITLLA